MEKHITAVAIIHIAFGLFGLAAAALVFLALAGGGLLSGDVQAIFITGGIAAAVGGFLAVTALPSVIGGFGLLQRRNWARIVILIVAVFDVFNVPVGTAITVYTFWVLLQDETRARFGAL
jgi:hypothetical protein